MNAHPSFCWSPCFIYFPISLFVFSQLFGHTIHFSPTHFTHLIHPPMMKTSQLLLTLISMALLAMTLVSASSSNKNKMRLESLAQKRRRTARQVLARNKAAFAAYSTFHAHSERFSSCGNPNTDLVNITSIQSSEHLCSGCQACVKIDGVLKENVEKGAVVKVVVTKFFFTVFERTFDLCESLGLVPGNEGEGGAGVKCPIEPMPTEGLKACFPLDKSLPTGVSFLLLFINACCLLSLCLVDMFGCVTNHVFLCIFPIADLGKYLGDGIVGREETVVLRSGFRVD